MKKSSFVLSLFAVAFALTGLFLGVRDSHIVTLVGFFDVIAYIGKFPVSDPFFVTYFIFTIFALFISLITSILSIIKLKSANLVTLIFDYIALAIGIFVGLFYWVGVNKNGSDINSNAKFIVGIILASPFTLLIVFLSHLILLVSLSLPVNTVIVAYENTFDKEDKDMVKMSARDFDMLMERANKRKRRR